MIFNQFAPASNLWRWALLLGHNQPPDQRMEQGQIVSVQDNALNLVLYETCSKHGLILGGQAVQDKVEVCTCIVVQRRFGGGSGDLCIGLGRRTRGIRRWFSRQARAASRDINSCRKCHRQQKKPWSCLVWGGKQE
jgi:hypothetical protein